MTELLLAALVVSPFYLWRYHIDACRIARLKGHTAGWSKGATIDFGSVVIYGGAPFIVEKASWQARQNEATLLVLEATDAYSFQQRHAVPVD